jgi:hypothetical protein
VGKPKSAGGGKRLDEAQGRALVEDWQRSGLRMSEYSRERGVPEHLLRYWSSRETKSRKVRAASSEFYVMSAPAPAAQAVADKGHGAGGAIIVVLPSVTPGELIQTLRGLREGVGA